MGLGHGFIYFDCKKRSIWLNYIINFRTLLTYKKRQNQNGFALVSGNGIIFILPLFLLFL